MLKEKYAVQKKNFDFSRITNPVVTALSLNKSVVVYPAQTTASLTTFDDYINEKINSEAHYMDYSNTCLIALTEAPTQNIKEWSTRKYEQNGINTSILKMISTGYHDPDVWRSILFQLQSAVYILHKKGICIWNFNLENNVYIKDTNFDNNNIGYWKYKVNGIDFFIPNFGAVVLIDTNFKDLDLGGTIVSNVVSSSNKSGIANIKEEEFRHKIMMSEFFDKSAIQIKELNDRNNYLFSNKVFNTNEFDSTTDKTYGGIAPDKTILSQIDDIRSKGNTIESIIVNHGHFLHNRVGTLLNDQEKKNVVIDNKEFNPGDLVAYTEDGTNYYVAVFFKANKQGNVVSNCNIIKITRDANNKVLRTEVKKNVDLAAVNIINEKVKQTYKPNMKLADEDLLETYEFNIQ
jgi:hypothetical protein